jgi:hypothetical protein
MYVWDERLATWQPAADADEEHAVVLLVSGTGAHAADAGVSRESDGVACGDVVVRG